MANNKTKNKYFDKSEVISEYYSNFVKDVLPLLNEFEKIRKNNLILLSLLFVVIIISMYFIWKIYTFASSTTIAAFTIGIILLIFFYYIFAIEYVKSLKKSCMKSLISCFGNMKWKTPQSRIGDYYFEKSDLFSVYTHREDDDSFVGKYKDVEYHVVETYLYQILEISNKHKLFWPVFDGVVIMFQSNKEIKNKTIVTTKGDINVRGRNPIVFSFLFLVAIIFIPTLIQIILNGDLAQFFYVLFNSNFFFIGIIFFTIAFICYRFCGYKSSENLNKINLEDSVFARKYNAYSSDEVEGRYLLTTAFMERFNNLHTAFGARRAKCSFFDDKIMFSIATMKNLFEIGNLFSPVNNDKQINKFLAEISAIFDLIDYFKIDEKTGL